ncbi:MAG: hypothetical protein Q8M16_11190 [Pirellulaceae bacterium]|nr:hypothetical protein [Pirellulaceae bacterium]
MFVIVAAALFYSEPDLLAAIFFGFVVSVVEFPFFVAVVYVARRLLAKVPTHGIIVATILAAIAMNTPLAIVAQLGRIG